MRRLVLILGVLFFSGLHAGAFDQAFTQAQEAYDSGNYPEAVRLYENMLSNGVVNIEVHYNLANARFKSGDLPNAVWHYRKAWYDAPRDPDIDANLHFALNAAGAIEPARSFMGRFLATCSALEWIWVASASYCIIAMLLVLAFVMRAVRPTLLKLCLLPLAALVLSAGGWWQWKTFRSMPEAVVIKGGTTALYGPVEGGTAHYKVPQAALVRQRSYDPKGWVEIEYDGKRGWIRKENIHTLSP